MTHAKGFAPSRPEDTKAADTPATAQAAAGDEASVIRKIPVLSTLASLAAELRATVLRDRASKLRTKNHYDQIDDAKRHAEKDETGND